MKRKLKFRAWTGEEMIYRSLFDRNWYTQSLVGKLVRTAMPDDEHYFKVMQFTGFTDKKGNEIYEGDILSDWTETDEVRTQSFQKVFWNDPTGSWHLDESHDQDETWSSELWQALNGFEYEITGNIYESKT